MPGQMPPFRVHLERVVNLMQRGQDLFRENFHFRQDDIQRRAAVALGQHKTVAVRPIWILWVDPHLAEIQHGENLDDGH